MAEAPASVRALSFGEIADNYDRYRPPPPPEAVDWALAVGTSDVLELGAGTGGLTRRLLDKVDGRVVAVEPDERMRAVLARRSPGALVVGSFAEALPLVSGRFDAVISSSAWHWMDLEPTVAEVARVLRADGRLCVLGSGPDRRVGWVADLLEDWNGPSKEAGRRGKRADGRAHDGGPSELPAGAPFSDAEMTHIEWSHSMTKEQILGLAGTYSRILTMPAGEQEAHRARLEALLVDHAAFRDGESIELPMRCRCWHVTRT